MHGLLIGFLTQLRHRFVVSDDTYAKVNPRLSTVRELL